MALEALAAQAAAAQHIQTQNEVIQDRSVSISPYARIRHDEPLDFSGARLGAGLTPDFSLSKFLTPASEAPRYTSARLDIPASSGIPWGAIAAGVAFLGYEAASIAAARRSKHPWKTFGLTQAVGALGVACAAPMAEVLIIEKAPFTLSTESAVSRIKDRGSSFMIGNSNASFTDVACESESGAVAFCTARLSIDNTMVGNAALFVQSTGEVLVANLASGHFAIDVDGKNATGQLAVLTKDKKLIQQPDASFGATMSNGVIDSISWVRVGDQILDIGQTEAIKTDDAFVSVISKPEFMQASAVMVAAFTASESIPTSTLTPQSTERPTAVPTPTEIPDPNMPLGEAGKDAEGKYVKMENGDIARKVEYKTASGEVLWSGWAVEKTQAGGIPLLDILHFNLIPTKLYVSPDVAGGHNLKSLTHPDNTESFNSFGSLDGQVRSYLYARLNVDSTNSTQLNDLERLLRAEGAPLSLITSTGESVEMLLGPDTGFITIVVPYDSLDPATLNGVSEWLDPYPESRSSFRSTVLGVDKDGNIIGLIASKKPFNELPDNLIRALALFHPENVIREEDQMKQEFTVGTQIFVQYADAKRDKKVPDIIITRNP